MTGRTGRTGRTKLIKLRATPWLKNPRGQGVKLSKKLSGWGKAITYAILLTCIIFFVYQQFYLFDKYCDRLEKRHCFFLIKIKEITVVSLLSPVKEFNEKPA